MTSNLCSKKGFDVESYGTGTVVKLPGPASEQPNVYAFGTTYEYMYQDLLSKDPILYLSQFTSAAHFVLFTYRCGEQCEAS